MDDTTAIEDDDLRPSRSQRRREALDTLDLARQLVALTPARLAKIDLPNDIADEVANVRSITSHVAHKRQLQFLAKQMRRLDPEELEPARVALGDDQAKRQREAAALHRLEAWRERLLTEGDAALGDLVDNYPDVDRQHVRTLIRQAGKEQQQGKSPRSARALLRYLRDLD